MSKRLSQRIASVAFAAALLIGALTPLAACNTTAGVGQDVSAAGHAVTNSAEKVKQGL
jgi:entericidin B